MTPVPHFWSGLYTRVGTSLTPHPSQGDFGHWTLLPSVPLFTPTVIVFSPVASVVFGGVQRGHPSHTLPLSHLLTSTHPNPLLLEITPDYKFGPEQCPLPVPKGPPLVRLPILSTVLRSPPLTPSGSRVPRPWRRLHVSTVSVFGAINGFTVYTRSGRGTYTLSQNKILFTGPQRLSTCEFSRKTHTLTPLDKVRFFRTFPK